MKGVVFLGDRRLEIRDFPDPHPGPGQVVVKMQAASVCGSDLRPYRSSAEALGAGTSIIRGHEPCGVVAEVGPAVRNVQVGDRIMVHHYAGCGRCQHCKTGWPQLCQHGMTLYGADDHGGFADYQLIQDFMCVPMPDDLSFEEGAACACGTGTAYQALRRLSVSGRDVLAIYGQGPVGVSGTLLATVMGARVIGVDPVAGRREMAERLGAWKTVDPTQTNPVEAIYELTHGEGADTSLDATGTDEGRVNAVRSTRIWGRSCMVGAGGTVTYTPTPDIMHRQLTLLGSWTFSTVILEELGQWVVDRQIPLRDVFTHRYPLERAEEAFKLFDQAATGKVVFLWE